MADQRSIDDESCGASAICIDSIDNTQGYQEVCKVRQVDPGIEREFRQIEYLQGK